MRNKLLWSALTLLITVSLVLSACSPDTTSTTTKSKTSTATTAKSTSTSTPASTAASTSTTQTKANWWDEFGEPEYGGSITIREGELTGLLWDPQTPFTTAYTTFYSESLWGPGWTVDRNDWAFNMGFTPVEYIQGLLAESWKWKDPTTLEVKLRNDVYWQDKAPVNGRKFTAEDVKYSYDRMLATGSGFTEPDPFWVASLPLVKEIAVIDDYTIEFRLKQQSAMSIYQITEAAMMRSVAIVPREWVELTQEERDDWQTAIGTGPWMLDNMVVGTSLTFKPNPNYYGYDERWPENQLPYADEYKALSIIDLSTAVAALRTGKVDLIVQTRGGLGWQQVENIKENNPDIQLEWLPNPGYCLDMMCDTKPFTDVKVRTAMQMAIDCTTIAKTYYHETVDGQTCGVDSQLYSGWVTPVAEWPNDIKEEYSYNPEKAKQLLADAGYPSGFKTNVIASSNDDMQFLQILKGYFMDIGVDMDIQVYDGTAFRALTSSGKADQMVMSNGTAMPFGPDWCIRFRGSTNTRDNFCRNNDATYDAMIAEYDSCTDIECAQEISKKADLYLLRQHWAVQTMPTATPFAWQPYLKGYTGEVIIGNQWHGFYPARLWIDQDMKKSMGY